MYSFEKIIEWKNSLKNIKYSKSYNHLDNNFDIGRIENIHKVSCAINNLNKHQFLPFIKRIDRTKKYKNKESIKVKEIKKRPIMYASHIDSQIYSFFNFLISKEYESFIEDIKITDNVIAYRKVEEFDSGKGKSNIHFAKEVMDYINLNKDCVVVMLDIKGFFDNLKHKILKDQLSKVLKVEKIPDDTYKMFESLTRFNFINYDDFEKNYKIFKKSSEPTYKVWKSYINKNETGVAIPQGSPISGLLANLYMIDLDKFIVDNYPDFFYRRYSDDILIIANLDSDINKLLEDIYREIGLLKLSIQKNKTNIVYIKDKIIEVVKFSDKNGNLIDTNKKTFDYLGVEFGSGIEVRIRKKTLFNNRKKSLNRVKKRLFNTKYKKKEGKIKKDKKKSSVKDAYFYRASKILDSKSINNQMLKIRKLKNKIRKN